MLKTILSISGKPGLYKLISQGKNMLIVESVNAEKKRFPAYGNEKIISLADIAMYTDDAAASSLTSPSGLNSVIPLEIKMLYQATNFLISATYTRSRSKFGNTSAKYSRNCSGVAFFGYGDNNK